MKQEIIALRVEPEFKREIEIIAKVLHLSTAEWIRSKLAYDVKEIVNDLKAQIVLEYQRGNITKKELKVVFGKEISEDIDFVIKKTKKDFADVGKIDAAG